jgi:methyl-accepting chemotaxis protein
LDHVTQQNAAMFDKTTAANHALMQEATALTEAVSIFKLSENISLPALPIEGGYVDPLMKKAVGFSGSQKNETRPPSNLSGWEEF